MKSVLHGFLELMFPRICACCGIHLAGGELCLCEFCKFERFEPADSSVDGFQDEILAEYVVFRTALWQFGKGGGLRDLMHRLKYEHLYDLGVDFGMELGRLIARKAAAAGLGFCYQPILVPVPLHKRKTRKRGYNQAAAIAQGVARTTGWSVIDDGCVVRTRVTRTQTGLTPDQRRENVSGAFRIGGIRFLPWELPVIIDDVYTTGATVTELSLVLRRAGALRIAIATLAEA